MTCVQEEVLVEDYRVSFMPLFMRLFMAVSMPLPSL